MPLLVLVFVVVQILEIYLLIQVGHAIGGWQTLVVLLLDSILGAALVRHQGRQTWRAFRRALDEKRMPAREVADGALVLIGARRLGLPGLPGPLRRTRQPAYGDVVEGEVVDLGQHEGPPPVGGRP